MKAFINTFKNAVKNFFKITADNYYAWMITGSTYIPNLEDINSVRGYQIAKNNQA